MKKITIVMTALLAAMAWTGCQNQFEQDDPTTLEEKAARDSVTLTLEAVKGIDTKALALSESDTKLNASWNSEEHVSVFVQDSENSIGSLTVIPKSDPSKATLTGNISTSGLSVNQTLTLLFPRATWSYDNQGGRLSSIASNFDYARATVTIKAIADGKVSTDQTSVTFENKQSIYRFGFRYGTADGPTIRTQTLHLSSNQNKLANTVDARTGTNTYFASGVPMTILPALTAEEATANALIYVAIRNDNTTENDTFSFEIFDNDGATYKGSKTIPSTSLSKSFVSAKTVALNRLELSQYAAPATPVTPL